MSTQCVYRCDICNTEKKQTNHWFLGLANGPRLMDGIRGVHFVGFGPWEDNQARDPEVAHLCGRECAGKYLDKMLQKMGEQK